MLKIMIPLARRNPCLEQGCKVVIEVAAGIKPGSPETWISWDSFTAELPFLTLNGEQKLYIDIPNGGCAIPPHCSIYSIIKHNTTVSGDIKNPIQYPPGVMVFNRLSGFIARNYNNSPLLIKWRFTVLEKGEDNISPWSYFYEAKECCIDNKNEPPPAIVEKQVIVQESINTCDEIVVLEPDIIQEVELISECPKQIFTLGSNLDFVIGAANKGSKVLENLLLKSTIKPISGVELEVVSMEGAYIAELGCTSITAHNPGVFIYHLQQISPKTEVVHHIFIKLLNAPVGASRVENIKCLYDKNREIICETSTVAINIAPKPSTGEAKIRILDSISREEIGMAEILSLEAEKIRKAISLARDVPTIISADDSLQDTLKNLIKYQILLEYKMEDALKIDDK